MSETSVYSPDLGGIEAGETAISNVKGQEGQLSYRGQAIEDLANKPFWQVVWLVLFGDWPNPTQESELQDFMSLHGKLNPRELAMLEALDPELHPMLVLQGLVPLLSLETKSQISGLSTIALQGLIIAAKLPTIVATWRQLETGSTPLPADDASTFHENFLTLFNGQAPTPEQVQTLDVTQILQMEHGFNAGTFAGRVCASTKAPIQSSISASIGTLFGVLHGGADQAALEMADSIGAPENARAYVDKALANKVKIMGMGHREYRVLDPRAKLLKPMAAELCQDGEAKRLFETLVATEDACRDAFNKKGKDIRANVEFYKGAVFHQLGVPPKYFTALFSMARVYGYIAHYLEFSTNSKLIRPKARYIGK